MTIIDDYYVHRLRVRYYEIDPQGVVYNSWYLAWVDDALGGFMKHKQLDYKAMMDEGFDMQLVHAELDWHGSFGGGDEVEIVVSPAGIGNTSCWFDFRLQRDGEAVVDARIVYVMIATDGSGKRPVPDRVRAVMEPLRPLRSE